MRFEFLSHRQKMQLLMACLSVCMSLVAGGAEEGEAGAAAESADVANSTARPTTPLPRNLHNLFCIILSGFVAAWVAKVALQLLKAADLKVKLARAQSLQLEGMSVYANDFQLLIRQHFNQILRIRRTVPPKPMSRYAMSIHLHPESIAVCGGDASSQGEAPSQAARTSGGFGVKFTADALAPCSVRLFWGVPAAACNDFVQRHQAEDAPAGRRGGSRGGRGRGGPLAGVGGGGRGGHGLLAAPGVSGPSSWASRSATATQESQRSLLEMEELDGHSVGLGGMSGVEAGPGIFPAGQYVAQSRDFFLPAGAGQRYATPAGDLVAPSQLPFDLRAPWLRDGAAMPEDGSAVMPLVIVALAQSRPSHELGGVQGRSVVEAHGQVSFVRFQGVNESSGMPHTPEVVRQLSFGIGAAYEVQGVYGFEEDGGEGECMICYMRPKNVLLLPCRHCSVCHPCLRSLRDEKCPLCRSVFSSYTTFPISRERVGSGGSATPRGGDATAPSRGGAGAASNASGVAAPVAAASARAGEASSQGSAAPSSHPTPAARPAASRPPLDPQTQRAMAAAAAESRAANACRENAAAAGGGAATSGAATAQAQETRQARDVQLCRPRGVAPASRTTSQGLRLSGRARFSDRPGEAADTPLLLDGGGAASSAAAGTSASQSRHFGSGAPQREGHEPVEAMELVRRGPQAGASAAGEEEEEASLIVGGGADSVAGEGP